MRGVNCGWNGRALATLLAVVTVLGCGDSGTEPEGDPISDVLTQVALAGSGNATLRTGSPPSAGSGPALTSRTEAAVVVGGSLGLDLFSVNAFDRIIVGIQGRAGYFDITLGSPTTNASVVVTLDQNAATEAFDLFVSAASGGTFGPRAMTNVTPIEVGTGDVQVSLSWDSDADLDLHVVDPSGEEIYYGNRTSLSGGELDLDSNAACSDLGDENENITWPTGSAPTGEYVVRVNHWDNCNATVSNYVVTVRRAGQEPLVFNGQFTGGGNGGGLGDGVEITRFTVN